MLSVVTLLWAPNAKSYQFSRCYDETWVEKLYRGFRRNLTVPFRFRCFVDTFRQFQEPIEQILIVQRPIGYGSCIEPYKLNEPMILVGLDTVILGNIDHMAEYCLREHRIAVPRDPFEPSKVCNGVALVPAGNRDVYDAWTGQNDMQWMRLREGLSLLDDLFPGEVVSYKGHAKEHGIEGAKIVYFHGNPKMSEIQDRPILAHWT